MTAHLTEEEQLEQLKRLWKDYGRSVVLGAVLAIGGYLAYEGWSQHRQGQAEAASKLFNNLQEISSLEQLSEEQQATAGHVAQQLKNDHGDSLYASYAAMLLARIAVENNQLDKAAEELRWALAKNPSGSISAVLRARLARVVAEQGDFDAAHKLVATAEDSSFAALFAEVRGDIYYRQQRYEEARSAYQQAIDKLLPEEMKQRGLLEIKLNDLPSAAETPAEAPQQTGEKQ